MIMSDDKKTLGKLCLTLLIYGRYLSNTLANTPLMYTISNNMDMNKTAIDLFCGCGGISEGLRRSGFNVLAGIDSEKKYISTFDNNFPKTNSFTVDLRSLSPQKVMQSIGINEGELTLLAGGPPCQGFSKNVPRKYRFLEDKNNLLIKIFLDYCEALKPKMVLMENVAEMKNGFQQSYTEEIFERLKAVGYDVINVVLNAADFGVPQRRRRAFFLANNLGVAFKAPRGNYSKPTNQPKLISIPTHVSVWDAIGDLPSVDHGEGEQITDYTCSPFSEYQKTIRGKNKHVANHIARKLQPTQYARYEALKPGEGHKDLPKNLQVKSGYSGAYGRLTKTMIAPTITRWVFHPGSGRWGHPVDIRSLTIREAARIQGFPDKYEFVGSFNDMAGQLGNAVPPLLIESIVKDMCNQTEESKSSIILKNCSNDILSSAVGS